MDSNFIPALKYHRLTPFYDLVVRLTTRETAFKKSLIKQSRLAPAASVLDLACGTGTLAILIKQEYPSTTVRGIDIDTKILKIAERKAVARRVEISFDRGASFALPYPSESYDRVLSSLFFHHLTRENKLKTFREIFRILKADGELHIADWGLPANFLMKIASGAVVKLDGAETTADNFTGFLPTLVAQTGFQTVEETIYFNSMLGTIRLLKAKKVSG
jgi:ubiquinone/menaquinone biosynthesis C-methylase UbiE